MLTSLAGGRVVLALEGGYNLTSISNSFVACTRALLGLPAPAVPLDDAETACQEPLGSVVASPAA